MCVGREEQLRTQPVTADPVTADPVTTDPVTARPACPALQLQPGHGEHRWVMLSLGVLA